MSSHDWLATVEEDGDFDEDGDGNNSGLAGTTRCWRLATNPVRCCKGAFVLCKGLVRSGRGGRKPELERIRSLREAVMRTTSALSAPFLHMSAYLVRAP